MIEVIEVLKALGVPASVILWAALFVWQTKNFNIERKEYLCTIKKFIETVAELKEAIQGLKNEIKNRK